jgi:hypothetical protein
MANALVLCKTILERVQQNGRLTTTEKHQILGIAFALCNNMLRSGVLDDQPSEVLELPSQFLVPRIENRDLENKCANTDEE